MLDVLHHSEKVTEAETEGMSSTSISVSSFIFNFFNFKYFK